MTAPGPEPAGPDPAIAALAAALPKAELHVHLVGSASPDTVAELAARHGAPPDELPEVLTRHGGRAGFTRFARSFGKVSRLVRTGEDLILLADRLAADLARHRVRHAEVQVTATAHRAAGLSLDELGRALAAGRQRARRHGLSWAWILDADSADGPPGAERTVDLAVLLRDTGVIGVGLGGPEAGAPRADFRDAFDRARRAGLHRVPHAGECTGAGEVRAALDVLHAERIGHGIGAAGDPGLLAELAGRGVALEVCPTSNTLTGAVPSGRRHPLRTLLSAGVRVVPGTDDPGLFGSDPTGEYVRCAAIAGLDRDGVVALARAGAAAAFCDRDLRSRLHAGIDEVAAAHLGGSPVAAHEVAPAGSGVHARAVAVRGESGHRVEP